MRWGFLRWWTGCPPGSGSGAGSAGIADNVAEADCGGGGGWGWAWGLLTGQPLADVEGTAVGASPSWWTLLTRAHGHTAPARRQSASAGRPFVSGGDCSAARECPAADAPTASVGEPASQPRVPDACAGGPSRGPAPGSPAPHSRTALLGGARGCGGHALLEVTRT